MIKTFGSAEELFDELARMEDEAVRVYSDSPEWKKSLKAGDYFVRVCPYEGLTIYGQCIDSKYPEDQESIEEGRTRGYQFSRCYSVLCPEGELGDTHVSHMSAKLTKEQFEQARDAGWPNIAQ